MQADTIAALASAAGRAGVAVLRVSGADVPAIAQGVVGDLPKARMAVARAFVDADGTPIDHGLALYFPAPASFTGEAVLELHSHGSPVLVDRLLTRLAELGARPAEPGEFSQRAFLNDKLTLDQAEAVADAINAASVAAAHAAVRSLEGAFSEAVDAIIERLMQLRAATEGAIDFPDEEDVDLLDIAYIDAELVAIEREINDVLANAEHGAALSEGRRLVLAGRPNVGKSSLMNALAQRDAAIVTDIAGTTRDLLEHKIVLGGLPITLIDTAGLRETSNPIEVEGVRRAREAVERADQALFVIDARAGMTAADSAYLALLPASLPVTIVANKIDLCDYRRDVRDGEHPKLGLSAATGAGLDVLRNHIAAGAGTGGSDTLPVFTARRRHLRALEAATGALASGRARFATDHAGELLADELRVAQDYLAQITGRVSNETLLGEIFSRFCIGK